MTKLLGLFASALVLILLAAGCSSGSSESSFISLQAIDPADFVSVIDNPYFPLTPGTTFIYESRTDDELTRNTVTVTDKTEVILGVATTVVHDTVRVNGVLTEDTFDFFAQDREGTVHYFGENTVEFLFDAQGNPIGTSTEGTWRAGENGAEPGIIMLANPRSGVSYRQEFAEGVAEDFAKVLRLNAKVSVPFGDFTNVLVTKEWTPLERGAIAKKFYAPGIGLILEEELKGKTVRLELVDIQTSGG